MDYDYDSYLEYMTCEKDDYYNLDNEELCKGDFIDGSDTGLSREDTRVKFDIEISRESLIKKINDYFDIGNSFTYELTRVKTADLTIDDFEEWTEENTENLTDCIIDLLNGIVKQI